VPPDPETDCLDGVSGTVRRLCELDQPAHQLKDDRAEGEELLVVTARWKRCSKTMASFHC